MFDEVIPDGKFSTSQEESDSSLSSVGQRVSYRLLQTTFCDFDLQRFFIKLPLTVLNDSQKTTSLALLACLLIFS